MKEVWIWVVPGSERATRNKTRGVQLYRLYWCIGIGIGGCGGSGGGVGGGGVGGTGHG